MSKFRGVGRPRSFNSPEELRDQVDAYFLDCEECDEPPFMIGIAIECGIDRDTLLQYANGVYDEEGATLTFSGTMKRARLIVEHWKSKQLVKAKGSTIGLIFDLKNNHNWADKTETQVNQVVTTTVKKDMGSEEAQDAYNKQMG